MNLNQQRHTLSSASSSSYHLPTELVAYKLSSAQVRILQFCCEGKDGREEVAAGVEAN
jgi:hypothetical protein